MAFEPGDVVFLKSGGQPMTVAAVEEDSAECLWLGEEGELFRETIPSVALTTAPDAAEDDDEDDEDDEERAATHEDADAEEEEEEKPKRKRKTA